MQKMTLTSQLCVNILGSPKKVVWAINIKEKFKPSSLFFKTLKTFMVAAFPF